MPRERFKPTPASQVLAAVNAHLGNTLLAPIGDRLNAVLAFGEEASQLHRSIRAILERLPSKEHILSDRFLFDASLLAAVSEQWACGLSQMIVPVYGSPWGYDRLHVPSLNHNEIPRIDLIFFPGQADELSIDLLDYPWLCHELGHCILRREHCLFSSEFSRTLQAYAQSLSLRSLADTGSAREQSRRAIDRLTTHWSPSGDHRNWAHELSVDTIALWCCGPAFLAAFNDLIHDDALDPYHISQSHPPYEVRAEAAIRASRELKFEKFTSEIAAQVTSWKSSRWAGGRTNDYIALTPRELVSAAVDHTLHICSTIRLPKCNESTLTLCRDEPIPAFGMDSILKAYTEQADHGSHAFRNWQTNYVKTILRELRQ
jgi:hypothetical protein